MSKKPIIVIHNEGDRFTFSEEQIKAFNNVINAIEKAKKKGLSFYGKQDSLAAYTTEASIYIQKNIDKIDRVDKSIAQEIPVMRSRVLDDSGADDVDHFFD